MSNLGWAFVGFMLGSVAALLWSSLNDSQLVKAAISAEKDGRTINNQTMESFYPRSFRVEHPEYLERDFEAGADFICDEIQIRYHEDMCSKDGIGWR